MSMGYIVKVIVTGDQWLFEVSVALVARGTGLSEGDPV